MEIFTRATSSDQPPVAELTPGVLVRHIVAGPFEGLDKQELPGQLCSFAAGVMRAEARSAPGHYDVVHSHYWLSGQVGYLAKDRWGVPLVHSAHTLAKVKNAAMADDDEPEPRGRLIGEEQVVAEADRLIANTATEADELIGLYGADPARIDVVPPGVDTDVFTPGDLQRARQRPGDRPSGRGDRVCRPDPAAEGAGGGGQGAPAARRPVPRVRWRLIIVGGESGTGRRSGHRLDELAARLGGRELIDFRAPVPAAELVELYRAADVVAVPSYNESFGLVALEAQAAGTPVVAAAVGGLTVAVAGGVSGLLVDGHDGQIWADALASVVLDPPVRARMATAAPVHAAMFSWEVTVDGCWRATRAPCAAVTHLRSTRPAQ